MWALLIVVTGRLAPPDVDQERLQLRQVRASPRQMLDRHLPLVFRSVQPLSVCGPDGPQRRRTRGRVRWIAMLRLGKMPEQETFVADRLPNDRKRVLPSDLPSPLDFRAVSGATIAVHQQISLVVHRRPAGASQQRTYRSVRDLPRTLPSCPVPRSKPERPQHRPGGCATAHTPARSCLRTQRRPPA